MDWSIIKATLAEYNIQIFDLVILSINLLLIIFARKLLGLFYHGSVKDKVFILRARIVQALNLFIFIFYSFNLYLAEQDQGVVTRLIYVIGIFYLGYLSQHILQYFIFRRYGKKREIEGQVTHIKTYNTRFLGILSAREVILKEAKNSGISLATPSLYQLEPPAVKNPVDSGLT